MPKTSNKESRNLLLSKACSNWSVKQLGELGKFQNGLNKGKNDFGFGTKFVNILDVYPPRLNVDNLGRLNASPGEIAIYQLEMGL